MTHHSKLRILPLVGGALEGSSQYAAVENQSKLKSSAAAGVWSWRETSEGGSQQVGSIRLAALGQGVIGGLIGTGVFFYLSQSVGYVAWGLSALLTLIGLLSPTGLYAKIRSGLEVFGSFVGQVMAWILLVPVYYLFFTPFRLMFRGGKKDAMTRWLDRDLDSYWVVREKQPSKEAYERQF